LSVAKASCSGARTSPTSAPVAVSTVYAEMLRVRFWARELRTFPYTQRIFPDLNSRSQSAIGRKYLK
jgi:hypothetical protein